MRTCVALVVVCVAGLLLPMDPAGRAVVTALACAGAIAECRQLWKMSLVVLLVSAAWVATSILMMMGTTSGAWLPYVLLMPALYLIPLYAGRLIGRFASRVWPGWWSTVK